MNCIRTCNNLEVMMHFFVTGLPHPRQNAPAVKEAMSFLYGEGMITQPHGAPRLTESPALAV